MGDEAVDALDDDQLTRRERARDESAIAFGVTDQELAATDTVGGADGIVRREVVRGDRLRDVARPQSAPALGERLGGDPEAVALAGLLHADAGEVAVEAAREVGDRQADRDGAGGVVALGGDGADHGGVALAVDVDGVLAADGEGGHGVAGDADAEFERRALHEAEDRAAGGDGLPFVDVAAEDDGVERRDELRLLAIDVVQAELLADRDDAGALGVDALGARAGLEAAESLARGRQLRTGDRGGEAGFVELLRGDGALLERAGGALLGRLRETGARLELGDDRAGFVDVLLAGAVLELREGGLGLGEVGVKLRAAGVEHGEIEGGEGGAGGDGVALVDRDRDHAVDALEAELALALRFEATEELPLHRIARLGDGDHRVDGEGARTIEGGGVLVGATERAAGEGDHTDHRDRGHERAAGSETARQKVTFSQGVAKKKRTRAVARRRVTR